MIDITTAAINVTGKSMPAVGLGLWKIPTDRVAERVYEAIAAGYRHLDSASDYGNERQVGEGIARALVDGLCQRGDLWIPSKLWNTYHRREHVEAACRKSPSATRRSGFSIPAPRIQRCNSIGCR